MKPQLTKWIFLSAALILAAPMYANDRSTTSSSDQKQTSNKHHKHKHKKQQQSGTAAQPTSKPTEQPGMMSPRKPGHLPDPGQQPAAHESSPGTTG